MATKVKTAKRCLKHLLRATKALPKVRMNHLRGNLRANHNRKDLNTLDDHLFKSLTAFRDLFEYEDLNGENMYLENSSSEEEDNDMGVLDFDDMPMDDLDDDVSFTFSYS